MLEEAWRQYRGWAAASRTLKAALDRQAIWTLAMALLAALLAAVAALPDQAGDVRRIAAVGAGFAALAITWFGRHVFDPKAQERWIAARAAAESIQSECYRYAASSGDYAAPDAAAKFSRRVAELPRQAEAKEVPFDTVAAAGPFDKQPPPEGLTAESYRETRLNDQATFYAGRSTKHATKARRGRWSVALLSGVGALLGFVAGLLGDAWIAPFVGMATTVAAAIAAYGATERHQFLASSYAGMARQIGWLTARHKDGVLAGVDLVAAGEDLLSAEHRAWGDAMVRRSLGEAESAR